MNKHQAYYFEVQHYTLCQGWTNCWTITDAAGNEALHRFATLQEAQAELDEFLKDIQIEIEQGDRLFEEGYDADEFRICKIVGDHQFSNQDI